ncbi:DNA-directed RNA polymerase subunit beta [Shouchella lehensis]|nr:DNA-directed RNA polymerase subunit beta [Shouchella lehensis]
MSDRSNDTSDKEIEGSSMQKETNESETKPDHDSSSDSMLEKSDQEQLANPETLEKENVQEPVQDHDDHDQEEGDHAEGENPEQVLLHEESEENTVESEKEVTDEKSVGAAPVHNQESMTREERKRKQQEEENASREDEPVKRGRIRLIPIWVRIILVTVLAGAALIMGLVIGFSVIGGEDNTWEVLKPELWYNIIDTIRGQ